MSLHNDIMNIPCIPPADANINQQLSYKYGHRDARHAAVELVAQQDADQVDYEKLTADAFAKVSPEIKTLIAQSLAAVKDREHDGFAQEMAMQYGFEIINDNADVYACNDEALVGMMTVLGYGRKQATEKAGAKQNQNLDDALKAFEAAACHQTYRLRDGIAAVMEYCRTTAQQDADKPTACVAPVSDKPACGAQNAECERQRDDPAMTGDDWLTEITAKVSTLIGCCIRIPKGGAKAHDDAVVTHGEVLALLHKRVQPASGEDVAAGAWLIEYFASPRTDLDDDIVLASSNNDPKELRAYIFKAMQQEKP